MEYLPSILFYMVSLMLLGSAFLAIFATRIIYSVLFAFIAFISVSFIYFMLNAPFIAASQIAIYGVSVSILFVFSIMLTAHNKEKNMYLAIAPRSLLAAAGLAMIFASVCIFIFEDYKSMLTESFFTSQISAIYNTTIDIAKGIFTNYILVFEIVSFFLLVVVVGIRVILYFKKAED